jgi:hypothetical protein
VSLIASKSAKSGRSGIFPKFMISNTVLANIISEFAMTANFSLPHQIILGLNQQLIAIQDAAPWRDAREARYVVD